MKFLHIITLVALSIAFTSAQDVDEGSGSEAVSTPEEYESVDSVSYSAGSNEEDFGLVEHDGEDLIRVKKTINGQLTTEYFTVIDIDIKSKSEDGQHDEEASAIDEEFFENYFANLENLD